MDHLSDFIFLKALVVLIFVAFLIWGVSFGLRFFNVFRDRQSLKNLTRVLEVCHLDSQRKLLVFTSPFGQGIVLISPRGDQLSFFPPRIIQESLEK